MKKNTSTILSAILFIVTTFILLVRSPLFVIIPGRDAGVFLYIAQHLFSDKVPYRDIWDHKGPMIYVINWFGLLIGFGSLWGVWIIEYISALIATFVGFKFLSHRFGLRAGFLSTLIWLFPFHVLLGKGNYPEEFMLPLEFITLYFIFIKRRRMTHWHTFVLGIFFGVVIFMKYSLLGIWVACAICFIYDTFKTKNYKKNSALLVWFGLGFLLIAGLMCSYFLYTQSFSYFYDAAITYNLGYSHSNTVKRFQVVSDGLGSLFFSGFSIFCLLGWSTALVKFIVKRRSTLLLFLIVVFPSTLFFTSLIGRSYIYYYISWFPMGTVLVAYILSKLKKLSYPDITQKILIGYSLLLIIGIIGDSVIYMYALSTSEKKTAIYKINQYIEKNTTKEDYIVIWGGETTQYFLTERKSPSKYVYQFPLITTGYSSSQMIQTYTNDLGNKKTKYIIDASVLSPIMPTIDAKKNMKWKTLFDSYYLPKELSILTNFVAKNYVVVDRIDKITIYKRKSI